MYLYLGYYIDLVIKKEQKEQGFLVQYFPFQRYKIYIQKCDLQKWCPKFHI